jgi:hypothetical protein
MAMKGKTPWEKVEDGTGFKAGRRQTAVYQRTGSGKASGCEKQIEVSKAGMKAPPETPGPGETVRDPEKESAYAGEVP